MFAKETRVDGLRVQGPPFLDANFLKIFIIFITIVFFYLVSTMY